MRRFGLKCCLFLLVVSCGSPQTPDSSLIASGVIGSEGGEVSTADGIAIRVPQGALTQDVTFTISKTTNSPSGAIKGVDFGPSGTTFLKPATIAFPVSLSDGALKRLKVVTITDGDWKALTGRKARSTEVSGITSHLSPYSLIVSNEDCGDHSDNDGDNKIDCQDDACVGEPNCSTAVCNVDGDCGGGYSCVSNVCVPPVMDGGPGPCGSSSECGDGYECIDGSCVAIEEGDGGSDMDGGQPDGGFVSCENTGDCQFDEICRNNICVPNLDGGSDTDGGVVGGCSSDDECFSFEKCLNHVCVDQSGGADGGTEGCGSDDDCFSYEKCISGICVDQSSGGGSDGGASGCASNDDCFSDELCVNGTCVGQAMDAGTTGCTGDEDCFSDERCESGSCVPYEVPDAGPLPCTDDFDCFCDESCVSGTCQPNGGASCTVDEDCPAGDTCFDNVCEHASPIYCSEDAECDFDQVCSASGVCVPAP